MNDDREMWVAVAVVPFRGDRVLAFRRAPDRDAGAGLWEVVSGRVLPFEEPLDAARRELREETGLDGVVSERPVDAYAARRGDRPMTVIVYRAELSAGEPRASPEHDAHRLCTVDGFAELTSLDRLALSVRKAARERSG